MIMAAAHLLSRHGDPTDADIDRAMTNLCRCATYVRIRAAIHLAAKAANTAHSASKDARESAGETNAKAK
jgi:aerobic-type carbon monoxide dehydrogenase small subunit (CoxS/CutS family)